MASASPRWKQGLLPHSAGSQGCPLLQAPEGQAPPSGTWQYGPPFALLPEAIQGGQKRQRAGHRQPPTSHAAGLGAGSTFVPTFPGACIGTPALPPPLPVGTRAPGMWLRILSPGATDSCLSGRGRRPAFRPLIATNSKERGHAQALPSRPQGRQAGGGGGLSTAPHTPEPQLTGPPPAPTEPQESCHRAGDPWLQPGCTSGLQPGMSTRVSPRPA